MHCSQKVSSKLDSQLMIMNYALSFGIFFNLFICKESGAPFLLKELFKTLFGYYIKTVNGL